MQLPARLGKYELQEFLGGGMSHVYRAFDTVIGRTVAVKILTEQGAQDADTRDRFLAEARTAARVSHENIISIYDFGTDPEKGLFMVMEFLQGEDLKHAIKNGNTGDLRRKLKIALQIARALGFIHQNRVIHRDIKPENVHIATNGAVKLMDFGIAKTEDLSRTQPGYVLGTPYYMAPEQVRGEPLTGAVDIYSFGVMLFELFTGQKVFAGDTVERIFYSILNVPINIEPLQQVGLPQDVIQLITACNAKAIADRPPNFTVIVEELERLIAREGGETVALPDVAAVTEAVRQRDAAKKPTTPKAGQPSTGKNPMMLAAVVGGVLALAIIAYLAFKPGAPRVPTLAKTISTPTGEMMLVPAGEFKFGEKQVSISLPAFYVDKTEVSNSAYAQFCQATSHALPANFPAGQPNLPVVSVTITDALAYAAWTGKRVPTEQEWEKAARGVDGRVFPWGNELDLSRVNINTNEVRTVDSLPQGASPYGAMHMAGNVWELVDKVTPAPSRLEPFAAMKPPVQQTETFYMVRGMSASNPELSKGVLWDHYGIPERWKDSFVGFRCVKDAK